MSYNLFLDDLRSIKMVYPQLSKDDFIIVRDFNSFVKTVKTKGLPSFISFDNDLGLTPSGKMAPDGYDCAKWLVYKSKIDIRTLTFKVHSANPVAKKQIITLLTNYIYFLNEDK